MRTDRLKMLADTIEPGVVEFPELGKVVVAFNMGVTYSKIEHPDPHASWRVPVREDIPDRRKVSACACFQGFAILLFSPLRYRMLSGSNDFDPATEARLLLELDEPQDLHLFYGNMSQSVTGEQGARVIRKLIMTGSLPYKW